MQIQVGRLTNVDRQTTCTYQKRGYRPFVASGPMTTFIKNCAPIQLYKYHDVNRKSMSNYYQHCHLLGLYHLRVRFYGRTLLEGFVWKKSLQGSNTCFDQDQSAWNSSSQRKILSSCKYSSLTNSPIQLELRGLLLIFASTTEPG